MPDQRISELTAAGALTGTEMIPLVQGGATCRASFSTVQDTVVEAVEAHTFTATGGTTARTLAAHLSNEIWAINQGVTHGGVTDDKAALQAAMTLAAAAGKVLRLSPGTIRITATLLVPAGLTMVYTGDPDDCLIDFAYPGAAQDMMKVLNVSDVWIEGFSMDCHQSGTLVNGNCIDVTGSTNVSLRRLNLRNAADEGVNISGSTKVSYIDGLVTGSQSSGIIIQGNSSDVTVEGLDLTGNLGFGIFGDSATHLYLRRNRCTSSMLELIGVRYNCSHGEIIGNHAVSTGDNGISITGRYFTATDNICHTNYNSGIWVYGHSNTVTGNICYNNGQNGGGGGNYAGVRVSAAFGGIASNNTVTGNVCFDSQTVKTQKWGVQLGNGSAYGSWTTATAYAALTYVASGANLYLTTAGGTSGASAPVHTSGSVSDGAVTWLYINTSVGSFQASHNQVGGNQCYDNVTSDYQNDTTNNLNNFHAIGSLTAHTNSSANTIGLTLRNANVSSNSGIGVTFNCSTTDTVESAKIRGIRTNTPSNGGTYLDFLTQDGTVAGLTRRLRIREEGAIEVSKKLNLAPQTAEAYTPTAGDIAYADGATWDPGHGAGLYGRAASAWLPLMNSRTDANAGKRFGAIGDSITHFFSNVTSTNIYTLTNSFIAWLRVLSMQSIDLIDANVYAVGGYTTANMITDGFHTSAAAAGLDYCVILAGTNDLAVTTPAVTIANLNTIYNTVLASGCQVVAVAIIPRTNTMTTQRQQYMGYINGWIRWKASTDPRIYFVDPSLTLMDSAGGSSSTYIYDTLHPGVLGAYTIGKAIWAVMEPHVPHTERRLTHPLDTYHATDNPGGNLINLGLGLGTAGGKVSVDITGDVASNWQVLQQNGATIGTGACLCAKVSRTDGEQGEWQQLTVSGTSTGITGYIFRQSTTVTAPVFGDTLDGWAEFEIDAGHTNLIGVAFSWYDENTSVTTMTSRDMLYNSLPGTNSVYPTEAVRGVLRIPRHTVITGSDLGRPAVEVMFQTGAMSAVVRIGRIHVRRVVSY